MGSKPLPQMLLLRRESFPFELGGFHGFMCQVQAWRMEELGPAPAYARTELCLVQSVSVVSQQLAGDQIPGRRVQDVSLSPPLEDMADQTSVGSGGLARTPQRALPSSWAWHRVHPSILVHARAGVCSPLDSSPSSSRFLWN